MKKSLLLITALLVFSICFSIVAYGGEEPTPDPTGSLNRVSAAWEMGTFGL